MKRNFILYGQSKCFVSNYGEGILSYPDSKPGETMLDSGCGTGDLIKEIFLSGAEVIRVDNPAGMTLAAKPKFPGINLFILVIIISLFVSSCSSSRSSNSVSKDGYHLIFDGKTLDGWQYDPAYWRVENGVLVGEVTPSTLLKRNSFIIKKDLVTRDFDLKVEYRVSPLGNSGINYRSELIDSLPYAMRGYQADIDGQNNYTGQNYEERGRTTLAYRGQKVILNTQDASALLKDNIKNNAWTKTIVMGSLGSADSLKSEIRNEEWNEYHLIVKGNRLLHYINGILMSDVTDDDTANRKFSGSLGVQVHVGPPMKIEYRNFRIKEL